MQQVYFLLGFLCSINCLAQKFDPDFAPVVEGRSVGYSVALEADGGLLVSGWFSSVGHTPARMMVRLRADGSLNENFKLDPAIVGGGIHDIMPEADGRIYLRGIFRYTDKTKIEGVIAITSSGAIDPSFTPIETEDALAVRCAVLPNGNLITSVTTSIPGDLREHTVRLYRPDGTPHADFSPLVLGTTEESGYRSYLFDIGIQSDNAIILAGFNLSHEDRVQHSYRIDSTGRVDDGFDPVAEESSYHLGFRDIEIAEDTTIVLLTHSGKNVYLVDKNGLSYNEIALDEVTALELAVGDRKEIFAIGYGGVSLISGSRARKVASIDNTYSYDVAYRDGTFVSAGYHFTMTADGPSTGLLKFVAAHGDLGLDHEFAAKLYSPGTVNAVLPQPDGKVIAIGNFLWANGKAYNHIARFNADGTTDESFTPSARTHSSYLRDGVQLTDGKILVGGRSDQGFHQLELLDADGTSINASIPFPQFKNRPPEEAAPDVSYLSIDHNDRAYAASWNYVRTHHTTSQPIAAYEFTSEGTVATYRNYDEEVLDSVYYLCDMLVQPDNKLLLYGHMLQADGASRRGIVRLDELGNHDPTFAPELPDSFRVDAAALLPSGNIVIVGGATSRHSSGPERIYFYKLSSDGSRVADFGGQLRTTSLRLDVDFLYYLPGGLLYLSSDANSYNEQPIARKILFDTLGRPVTEFAPDITGSLSVFATDPITGDLWAGGRFLTPNGPVSLLRLKSDITSPADLLPSLTQQLTIYPNPSIGTSIDVDVTRATGLRQLHYRIYSLGSGRLISQGSTEVRGSQATLPTHQLKPGSYATVLLGGKQRWAGKFIVARQ